MPDVFVAEHKKEQHVHEHPKKPHELILEREPRTRNRLAAYCFNPHGVKFSGADDEEKIILILRKHPITNIPWIITALLMAIAPFIALVVFPLEQFPFGVQVIGILVWYLITLAFVIESFLRWFFNVNIITDERVFDVDFVNLVYREITDTNLDQVQDVTVKVGSVIRTMFDFGDIQIQTAAEIPQIEFVAVPHPDRVAKILRELRVEEELERLEGRVR